MIGNTYILFLLLVQLFEQQSAVLSAVDGTNEDIANLIQSLKNLFQCICRLNWKFQGDPNNFTCDFPSSKIIIFFLDMYVHIALSELKGLSGEM